MALTIDDHQHVHIQLPQRDVADVGGDVSGVVIPDEAVGVLPVAPVGRQ
jgi:hypothetical protein